MMQNQIYLYLKYQCLISLIATIDKLCQSLDSGRQATAVLTKFSKAFDCSIMNCELLNHIIEVLFLSIHTLLKESKELK